MVEAIDRLLKEAAERGRAAGSDAVNPYPLGTWFYRLFEMNRTK